MIPATITLAGQQFEAALCAECGARIFPVEEMEDHLASHRWTKTPPPQEWISQGLHPRTRRRLVKQGRPLKAESDKLHPDINIERNPGKRC